MSEIVCIVAAAVAATASLIVVFFVLWLAVRVLWAGQRHPLQRDAQHLQDDLAGSAGILVLRV